MFTWLTNLFKGTSVPEVINEIAKETPAPTKTTTKKKPATKAAKIDLDSMKKNELLAHAKDKGIKANASMNKAALIKAIKNG